MALICVPTGLTHDPLSYHADQFTFYLSLPSLKFTIFIQLSDDFDSADPSSTQDTCHIWAQLNDFSAHVFS